MVKASELAVGLEINVEGDGSTWEILELARDKVRARNTANGFTGFIPHSSIQGVVNKTVASIPSSDIQIMEDKPKTAPRKPRKRKPKIDEE